MESALSLYPYDEVPPSPPAPYPDVLDEIGEIEAMPFTAVSFHLISPFPPFNIFFVQDVSLQFIPSVVYSQFLDDEILGLIAAVPAAVIF